jgi:hypothetical protein
MSDPMAEALEKSRLLADATTPLAELEARLRTGPVEANGDGGRARPLRDDRRVRIRRPAELGGDEGKGRRASQADLLLELVDDAELFHDPLGDTYARVEVDGHWECWPTRSKGFRRWLVGRFYRRHAGAPSAEAAAAALNVIEARAQFDGTCRPVYLRLAPDGEGGLFLDLGDPAWRAVHVTPQGWQLVRRAPICFRRSPGMLALPTPVRGGALDELRPFVNAPDDHAWALIKAWLRASVRDRGPYPVLALHGEQGSAKTTLGRMLRALVDPAAPELRSEPRELRDLAIAARASWVVAFDNVSHLQPWLSDGLCRLATGGGWATRELYTDFDEVLFEAQRPVILNGITEVVTRGDLLDRAIQVVLPEIPEDDRRDERGLWASFEAARPRLLGALLDDAAGALRELPTVRLDRKPRMADFALWAVAAERGRGERALFSDAYAGVRALGHEQAIEGSAIGAPLRAFLEKALPWEGTASDLLERLNDLAGEQDRRAKYWPKTGRGLSSELRRLAPALRGMGFRVELPGDHRRAAKGRRLITIDRAAAPPSPPSPPSPASGDRRAPGDGRVTEGDGQGPAGDGPTRSGDGGDGRAARFSGRWNGPADADAALDWRA